MSHTAESLGSTVPFAAELRDELVASGHALAIIVNDRGVALADEVIE
jgi:hypothetical protein